MERRLTAILAADAVGYSKFMGADEETAFEALTERREIIDAIIEEREGRVFGSAGDSVIAEFTSSVKAARCAVEIQKQLGILNLQQSENRRMVFRVGVHTGDVIVKNDDLLGDGVNVAARIEGLAPAGGVAISAQVAEQISGKRVARFESAGKHKLKNISRAREIWCWPPEAAETVRVKVRSWRDHAVSAAKAMAAVFVFAFGVGYVGTDKHQPETPSLSLSASLTHPAASPTSPDNNDVSQTAEFPAREVRPSMLPADPELARKLQAALLRAGCGAGTVDGVWGRQSQGALERFALHAGLTLPSVAVNHETLELLEARQDHICPPGNRFAEHNTPSLRSQQLAQPLEERQRGVPYNGLGIDCDFVLFHGDPFC